MYAARPLRVVLFLHYVLRLVAESVQDVDTIEATSSLTARGQRIDTSKISLIDTSSEEKGSDNCQESMLTTVEGAENVGKIWDAVSLCAGDLAKLGETVREKMKASKASNVVYETQFA